MFCFQRCGQFSNETGVLVGDEVVFEVNVYAIEMVRYCEVYDGADQRGSFGSGDQVFQVGRSVAAADGHVNPDVFLVGSGDEFWKISIGHQDTIGIGIEESEVEVGEVGEVDRSNSIMPIPPAM